MAATEKSQEMIERAKLLKNVPWCDQYERMISGMLYDSFTPELEASRFRARAWCHKYNNWFPSPEEFPNADFKTLTTERLKQLREIIGHVGEDAFIEPPLTVDYGCNIRLGERAYANFNLCVLDCGLVTLGARTMIGPNVSIFAATHETEVQSRRDNVEYAGEVYIGDDCWIGGHTVILPNVRIGEGCTIGACSVVTKDIPPWSVAMGSPAKVVKKVTPLEKLDGRKSSFTAMERTG